MAEATGAIGQVQAEKRRSFWADVVIRLWREKHLGAFGGIITLCFLLTGIFANFLAPYSYVEVHLSEAIQPPSVKYLLGTDELGRDLLSRIIYGARVSMYVGLAATTIATVIAVTIGVTSGYIGGAYDMTIQRFVDAFMCFPQLFLVLSVMAVLGPGMVQVIVILGLRFGIGASRIVRSAVVSIKENMYIEAAVAVGCPTWKLLMRHVLPNVMAPIIVIFTTRIGSVILTESTLSFLGYGLPPPIPSWGGMLSGSGSQFMVMAPWLVVWPGIALGLVIYAVNMFGDAVRDLLDPRLRGGLGRYGEAKVEKAVKGKQIK